MTAGRLARFLRPRSIAVVGGGAWGRAVVVQCRRMGYDGAIYAVHPRQADLGGVACVPDLDALPQVPDAAFLAVNRTATIEAVARLSSLGAGGAVAFASGFAEAAAEDPEAPNLQENLREAAGRMPLLGPNCYGFINALDGALLWPDQHGLRRVDRGAAILTQSSNIAINLTMQNRGLPISYMLTCGNQAVTHQAEAAEALLEDERVTALGLHVEGFGSLAPWERLAQAARRRNVPVCVLKTGRSDAARQAALSHSASLAGADAGAQAFLERLGLIRAESLSSMLELLKLWHVVGPFAGRRIASVSCSGGEAALVADAGRRAGLCFPPLGSERQAQLRAVLGPRVALSNPLDYHTYIWRDVAAMRRAWAAMTGPDIDMTLFVVDYPRADRCDTADWTCATRAALEVRRTTGAPVAVVSTLSELMPEDRAAELMQGGVVPFCGLEDAMTALSQSAMPPPQADPPPLPPAPGAGGAPVLVAKYAAKAQLAAAGLQVPEGREARSVEEVELAARDLGFPLVLKRAEAAHKSDGGGVVLGIGTVAEAAAAARRMGSRRFLLERMIAGPGVELLLGVVRDPAHGFLLTLGPGGVMAELMSGRAGLLVPASRVDVDRALRAIPVDRLLRGYRGMPPMDREAVLDAVMAMQGYVLARREKLHEIEINPLFVTPRGAVALDALLREET